MKRFLILAAVLASASAGAEPLFKFQGKSYEAKDLSAAQQQQLHDLRTEEYARLEDFVDQAILDVHLEEEAKKTGKKRAELEETLFKTKEPTDAEVKEWFESNKARLPPGYKLEQIQGDIKNLLKQESRKKSREAVLAKLKKDGKLELGFKEPEAPTFDIKTDGFPVKGDAKAKVTLVEFADYQCPHCKAAGEVIHKLLKKHQGKMKLVFVDYPINPSGISLKVAHGSVCAEQQGKYWEYHEAAYKDQKALDQNAPATLAKALKLDEKKFDECMKSDAPVKRVDAGKAEGERIGVSGTPGLFLNGKRIRGYEEEALDAEIKKALTGA